jgi:PAS domain S-box-containing protein
MDNVFAGDDLSGVMRMLDAGRVGLLITARVSGMLMAKELGLDAIKLLSPPLSRLWVCHYLHERHKELVPTIPYSEFRPLVNVLDEMGEKIESHMRSLQLTQLAVDSSSVAIYWIDLDANISYANNAAVKNTGHFKEALEKMSLLDIEYNLSNKIWQERLEELKIEGSLTFESVHLRKDNSTVPVQVTSTFFKFADKEYVFAFVLKT